MGNKEGLLVFVLVLCSIIIYLSFLNVDNYITGFQASTGGNPAYTPTNTVPNGYAPPVVKLDPNEKIPYKLTSPDGKTVITVYKTRKQIEELEERLNNVPATPNKYIPSPVDRARNDGYNLGQMARENVLKQELKKLQNEAQHRTNQAALNGDVTNKPRDTEIANRINEINDILNRLKK